MDKELKSLLEKILHNQLIIYRKLMLIDNRQLDIPTIVNRIVNEKQSEIKVLQDLCDDEKILFLDVINSMDDERKELEQEFEMIKRIEAEE